MSIFFIRGFEREPIFSPRGRADGRLLTSSCQLTTVACHCTDNAGLITSTYLMSSRDMSTAQEALDAAQAEIKGLQLQCRAQEARCTEAEVQKVGRR